MTNSVCIVLNERETFKEKAAHALEAKLSAMGIASERLQITAELAKVITQKSPSVVVMDYLLGDISTGLDLIEEISKKPPKHKAEVFFFTDEPSVRVAVEAMRLGAKNYYELDNPQSIDQLAIEIKSILVSQNSNDHFVEPLVSLKDLVFLSPKSRELYKSSLRISTSTKPVTVLLGPAGSGRSTMAEAIHTSRSETTYLSKINADTFIGNFEDIIFPNHNVFSAELLGPGSSLLIDHLDEDNSDMLLEVLTNRFKSLWPKSKTGSQQPYLYIGTQSESVWKVWIKAFDGDSLTIPALSDRKDDIPALMARFIKELNESINLKIKNPEAKMLDWILAQNWVGNLAQLKQVVVNGLTRQNLTNEELETCLSEELELWEAEHSLLDSDFNPDPIEASLLLAKYNQDHRRVSALLGCSINTLRETIAESCQNNTKSK